MNAVFFIGNKMQQPEKNKKTRRKHAILMLLSPTPTLGADITIQTSLSRIISDPSIGQNTLIMALYEAYLNAISALRGHLMAVATDSRCQETSKSI